MNSVLIVVTLATLAAIYMISARGKPASAWVAATRTAVYTAIIGVALSAYALLTNLTAAEPISPIMLVFACPVLAIVAFLYTYWEDRTASLMTVLSTVWLFGLVSYAANEGGMRYGAGVLIAIPLGLRVMRLLDFASRPAYRVKRLTRSATRVSPTHYLHPLFEIAYQPGADTFTLKKALRLTKATKTAAGQTDPLLEYNEPVLIERTTGSNDIWHTNLACNFKKLTRTEYGQTVTSTYVPGTFTSGTTSSGEFVTMNTPGQTVYSSTPNGKTYEVDTGKTGATVSLSVAGKMQFIDLGVVTASEEKAIREVVAAIETLQAPRIAERNAAAIAERQRVRDEAAMALKQRQELAEQEKLAAQQAIAQRQQAALDQVLQRAGITAAAADLFLHRTHIPKTGELFELIVADRDGRGAAVADAGKSVWVGHWHGAEAQVAEGCLHLKLDDDAYRREHLAERRIKLLASGGLALQQQWADRITILSRAASQA
jgi:hypothetical protein